LSLFAKLVFSIRANFAFTKASPPLKLMKLKSLLFCTPIGFGLLFPLSRNGHQDLAHSDRSQWIQIAMDQLLGPDTGRVLNDMSEDLASGNTTPEKAAKALEASWQQNKS
jgi:raffinose/stachyose/melibiose transport system substrate-binding protein